MWNAGLYLANCVIENRHSLFNQIQCNRATGIVLLDPPWMHNDHSAQPPAHKTHSKIILATAVKEDTPKHFACNLQQNDMIRLI